MWQTKYAWAVPKNLGLGFDFRLCNEGDFLTRRLQSVDQIKQNVASSTDMFCECKHSDLSPILPVCLKLYKCSHQIHPVLPFSCAKKGATTSSFGKYFPRKCVFSREKLFKVMLGKISYYAVFVQALPSALLLLLLWYSSAQCVHLRIQVPK